MHLPAEHMHPTHEPVGKGDALIVVDMQYDFMPGGALPVEGGDTIIPGINTLMQRFRERSLCIIMTQDWHPHHHNSFASAHAGKKPFEVYRAAGIGPVLWPDHCMQGTHGAEFHHDIKSGYAQAIIRKGYHQGVDSYSGFLENDKLTPTGMGGYLNTFHVKRIFICGLAFDYCVNYTAVDGVDLGFKVYVITDLSMPVGSPEDSITHAIQIMQKRGVVFITSDKLS